MWAKNFYVILMMVFSTSSFAEQLYLKPGSSKQINTRENIRTVFISSPDIADYKVISKRSIVLYGKKNGMAEISIYNNASKVIYNANLGVDPFLPDLSVRIKNEYPKSDIFIKRFNDNTGKSTYILTGVAESEEVKDSIYQLVGSLVGISPTDVKIKADIEMSVNNSEEIPFSSYKRYDNIINRIELPSSNQVNVKLTVVEVSKEFTDNLGIEWSSLTLDSMLKGDSFIANSPGTFNLLGFKHGFDARNISTLINAVQNDSIARVLAQPNLTVLSGESANFLVGGEIPILMQDRDTTTVTYKEYGIRLNIAAKVERKNKIKLFISNEVSSVTGTYGYNNYQIPTLKTRKSNSTIELADGDSFAIGGLLNEADKEALTQVPFIGDIPVLGALGRRTSTERTKTELVVFATVNLVKPVSSSQRIEIPSFQRTSSSKLFFNVGVNDKARDNRLENEVVTFLDKVGFTR
ncbi:pilus assembly protein N-terminal domain-containing protein [Salmonella enterica subsp. enterica serovar Chester]|nr:tight adherence secretin RcpA [Salmonella enterica subsp. enterica serovar Inganda]EDV0114393.1 tight adherence secretin RcpA [Salmonella enterica subsp. enterica]EJV0836036.1 pilus assembly protein N-terminal domain-containing protein [Salmonella enterica subsp. enterica serovar Chester]ELN8034323.1 pilus assembly protein N-terminal domain-containing protein [Salmonella enterica]